MKYILCYTKNTGGRRKIKYFNSELKANKFIFKKTLLDWAMYKDRIYLLDKTYFINCGKADTYWNR